jgi:hypothetical protein
MKMERGQIFIAFPFNAIYSIGHNRYESYQWSEEEQTQES